MLGLCTVRLGQPASQPARLLVVVTFAPFPFPFPVFPPVTANPPTYLLTSSPTYVLPHLAVLTQPIPSPNNRRYFSSVVFCPVLANNRYTAIISIISSTPPYSIIIWVPCSLL